MQLLMRDCGDGVNDGHAARRLVESLERCLDRRPVGRAVEQVVGGFESAGIRSYTCRMVRNNLLNELNAMSSAERILLAQDPWDSVSEDAEAWELPAAQKRVLDQRLRALARRKK